MSTTNIMEKQNRSTKESSFFNILFTFYVQIFTLFKYFFRDKMFQKHFDWLRQKEHEK